VLADASRSAHRRGEPDRAMALASEGLALAEAATPPDAEALAETRNMLGVLAARAGDQAGAIAHLERSLAQAEGLADPSAQVAALNNLALARRAAGGPENLEAARELTEAALAACVAQGDRHREAALRNNLADVLHELGRAEEAMAELKQAVAIFAEVGEQGRLEPEIWKLVEW
jgi:tetratricopeptide (TPR) repeat protein